MYPSGAYHEPSLQQPQASTRVSASAKDPQTRTPPALTSQFPSHLDSNFASSTSHAPPTYPVQRFKMQIFTFASIVFAAFTSVQADSIRKLQSSTVADWGDCSNGRVCSTATSTCVRFSQWYSQCLPGTLPNGALCGQSDGTNEWRHPYCPSGQSCVAVGTDYRCRASGPGTVGNPSGTTVATWGDCTGGKTCTNPTGQCVAHSQWYAQCKPATLPRGELCGQRDGATTLWQYPRCPSGQTCALIAGSTTDLRCQ